MAKLSTLIQEIQYDDSWGIWADAPFTPESDARYGQSQFKNGGLLDKKTYFATGTRCQDFLAEYCGDNREDFADEAARELIDEIEDERKENAE